MIVLIPTAIGQTIPAEVLEALALQGDVEPVQIATPGVLNSQGNGSLQRIRGEAKSRKACAVYADHLTGCTLVGMLDRDTVLPLGAIDSMAAEMQADSSIGVMS